jgi:antitoxin component YwqK of YwqJK toxin-antitoxin module
MNEINEKSEIIKTYHENGQVREEIEKLNNKLHGQYKLYHENGQLRLVTRNENGKQVDGVVDSYNDTGTLIRTVNVKNGNLDGPFKEFYPSGLIKKEGQYKDDEFIGKSLEYFEDGSIKNEFYIVNGVMIESAFFEQSDFYKFFIKKIEKFLLSLDIKNKSIYDFYYDIETIETTIIIEDKENILLNFAEIRIYSNKCEDQDDEHDSLGEIETPFIISFSSEIEDYILLTNFPNHRLDEDADNMNNDTGIRNLTFDELVETFNKMKVKDMSKFDIEDGDDFTYFD